MCPPPCLALIPTSAGSVVSEPLIMPLACDGLDPPATFANPFDELAPHPLAQLAAHRLMTELRSGIAGLLDEGKMFGVLVVRAADGTVGYLRAFSGTLRGRFDVAGFVPPVFDRAARAAVEEPGERIVSGLTVRARELATTANVDALLREKAALVQRQNAESDRLRERHDARRRERRQARACARQDDPALPGLMHELAQQSRGDKAERRALGERHRRELAELDGSLRRIERRLAAHARLQRSVSRRLMQQIHDTYRLTNARGRTCTLRERFVHAEPPGGAGDCAAPKLLCYAITHGLEPLAMAEFWWGPPPAGGGRVSRAYYPACREKCGPILPFLLDGLAVAPARRFSPPDGSLLGLPILHEDEWVVVVDKPAGLLSVPARSGSHDSVQARLERLYPGSMLVHRLDLDTSGVLVAARSASAHATLQQQFLRRTIEKRYVAIVEGDVHAGSGTIDLAIRADVTDRPRHIHDPEHGRRAVTHWEALRRSPDGTTRVTFQPVTGRTHQLRVHASHPLGLAAPIRGDRLYGHAADRLYLHAEVIAFDHPRTNERIRVVSRVPF